MSLSAASIGFGFVAGLLSVLSPCVLPLLPMVFSAAGASGRLGPAALGAGLVASFVAVGLCVGMTGYSAGLDSDFFRMTGALLLAGFGVLLLSSALRNRLAMAGGGLSDAGGRVLARHPRRGAGGQFLVGVLLGAVWSPCVGPTLGAASMLAAQGKSVGMVASVMAAFGLGAALPLLLAGALSRAAMQRWRGSLVGAGRGGGRVLGVITLALALSILTGADRRIETFLLDHAPDALTRWTTSL